MGKGLSSQAKQKVKLALKKFGEPLGLFQLNPKEWPFAAYGSAMISGGGSVETSRFVSSDWIEEKIRLRNEARAQKDFSTADTIRKKLAEQGIFLEDRPDGTTRWKR